MTAAWIIGVVLVVAILAFVLTKFAWAIRTQPQGRWRGPVRKRRSPPRDSERGGR
ncbi:MAG: hypothetical protein M3022_16370 [Actinomycetota bacterium]|nr:hypothetical protein [Actinomycetota bacterium]